MSTAARARQGPRRLEFVASEIAGLPGVETHTYRVGEVLLPTERVKHMHICVRDGALGLRLAAGRASHAILDVFGPGSMLTPQLWPAESSSETRHAAAPPDHQPAAAPAGARRSGGPGAARGGRARPRGTARRRGRAPVPAPLGPVAGGRVAAHRSACHYSSLHVRRDLMSWSGKAAR